MKHELHYVFPRVGDSWGRGEARCVKCGLPWPCTLEAVPLPFESTDSEGSHKHVAGDTHGLACTICSPRPPRPMIQSTD